MLDEMMGRAHARGLSNVVPMQGDVQQIPFPDATFDAAFLVATLGEVPDRDRALRDLRRVLKSGGRLIVGEGQPDPHMVPPRRVAQGGACGRASLMSATRAAGSVILLGSEPANVCPVPRGQHRLRSQERCVAAGVKNKRRPRVSAASTA